MNSRTELAAFFAPCGLRAKLAEVAISGETLLVGSFPLVNERQVEKLTEAEREVVAHLVVGSTNSDIAHRRHTSEHTVANQVHAIFLKLGSIHAPSWRRDCKPRLDCRHAGSAQLALPRRAKPGCQFDYSDVTLRRRRIAAGEEPQ